MNAQKLRVVALYTTSNVLLIFLTASFVMVLAPAQSNSNWSLFEQNTTSIVDTTVVNVLGTKINILGIDVNTPKYISEFLAIDIENSLLLAISYIFSVLCVVSCQSITTSTKTWSFVLVVFCFCAMTTSALGVVAFDMFEYPIWHYINAASFVVFNFFVLTEVQCCARPHVSYVKFIVPLFASLIFTAVFLTGAVFEYIEDKKDPLKRSEATASAWKLLAVVGEYGILISVFYSATQFPTRILETDFGKCLFTSDTKKNVWDSDGSEPLKL
jgi:hypothetical protein